MSQAHFRHRPLENLLPRGTRNDDNGSDFDFLTPIDRSRWFVCPTLTPLFYAPVYHELDACHQLRYNQLTALSFSELISFFETTFAASVLGALARSRRRQVDGELAACLEAFLAEERYHTEWWHRLNRLSEPQLYRDAEQCIMKLPASVRVILRGLTNHPFVFPMVFWVMLALEERSLEISRRCVRMPKEQIEPRYSAIYRAHLADEMRHVQIDWHLIDRYFADRSKALRHFNARLFRIAIEQYFLPPTRSAVRVVARLVAEYPELSPLLPTIRRQLIGVGHDAAYHEMMYSRESTPITFALFDRFEEFHNMRRVLHSYRPR